IIFQKERKPRHTHKYTLPLSGSHFLSPLAFTFFPLHSDFSSLLIFGLFFPSTRGSPWQCAGAGNRKWVSGSAQATGSSWLRSGCNLTPRAAQHTPAGLLTIDA
uniref:Uncharacterized protein n=1 Tax=Labrus bergylta TaxID=56723 RepID=A0A3Q3FY09_9LABR